MSAERGGMTTSAAPVRVASSGRAPVVEPVLAHEVSARGR